MAEVLLDEVELKTLNQLMKSILRETNSTFGYSSEDSNLFLHLPLSYSYS